LLASIGFSPRAMRSSFWWAWCMDSHRKVAHQEEHGHDRDVVGLLHDQREVRIEKGDGQEQGAQDAHRERHLGLPERLVAHGEQSSTAAAEMKIAGAVTALIRC
jgi:hypothetical protein